MASGCEKVQRVAGEGHQRVRNDHEQFLEAYEKPTHIYRFLQARNSLKPLFLQRNLAYMPRHGRKTNRRYKRKFSKTNVPPNHCGVQSTRKADLASEVKSDTRLEISFCCLEKGVNYQELLDARVGRDSSVLGTCEGKEGNPVTDEKEPEIPHGMLMEVEVLLFQFKHSSIHLSGESNPCQCSSLGKRTLEYRSSSVDQKESSTNALTLSIPESMFTWKSNSSGGTQMLVFRASCVPKPVAKKAPVPIHLINFVSRKGCRKNVAVSVNRLSLSDIGQTKVGGIVGKQLVQSANGCLSVESKPNAVDGEDDEVAVVDGPLSSGVQHNGMRGYSDEVSLVKMQVSSAFSSQSDQEMLPSSKSGTPHTHAGKPRILQSKNHGVSAKKLLKSSKPNKKASKDVSIMTDISFGTGVIQDPTILCQSSSPSPPPTPFPYLHLHDHQYTAAYKFSPSTFSSAAAGGNPLSSSISSCFPSSSFLTKKGFADKCTSPKMIFKNGTLNGLNGYLLPEVVGIRSGKDLTRNSIFESNKEPLLPLKVVSSVAPKKSKKKKKKKKKLFNKVKKQHKYYVGSGKHGLRSFLVSIPRMYFDKLTSSASTSKDSNFMPSNIQQAVHVRNGNSYFRSKRRTQVELLQEHLRSLGQKDSESDTPSSSMEDISSNLSPLANNNKWLCSSTRKITPVNLYNSPYSSPSFKKTGSFLPNVASPVGTNSFSSRKRSADASSDLPALPISNLGPPQKVPKILEDFPPRVSNVTKMLDEFPPRIAAISEPSKYHLLQKTEKVSDEDSEQKCPEPLVEVVVQEDSIGKGTQHQSDGEESKQTPQGLQESQTVAQDQQKRESDKARVLEGIYSGELVVFDSRGECLIKEGQYSILMQPEQKDESTFEPLTWSSVLGNQDGGKQRRPKSTCLNVLLKFSVSWSHGPPEHRLCSEMRAALDLQQIRDDYFDSLPPKLCPQSFPVTSVPPPSSPPPLLQDMTEFVPSPALSMSVTDGVVEEDMIETCMTLPVSQEDEPEEELESALPSPSSVIAADPVARQPKVVFNYLYSENCLQKTESQAGLVCPWCCLSCGKIYSLLKHMSVCHPRFHFTYMPGSKGRHVIDVHVNKLYDMTSSSSDRDPGEWNNITLARRKNGPSKCLSCTAVFVDRHMVIKEDLSEFLNDGSWRRGYNVNRVYHHCRTCLPMVQDEKDLDKDEEKLALQWQRTSSKKMIEEFTDVNQGEKELITLWNSFIMEKKIIAEKQVAMACLNFAQEMGELLKQKGLVANFMAHLVNLIEYGLISPSTLKESLRIVYDLEAGVS